MTIPDKAFPNANLNILVVDDEETVLRLYESILKSDGHHVFLAATGREAMAHLAESHFDLVFLDLKLPDMDGLAILKKIREKSAWIPVIIVTANPSLETSIEAIRAGGVYEYIIKPFSPENLRLSVRRAVEKSELSLQNRRLLKRLETANIVLTERVEELEKVATLAFEYEKQIDLLEKKVKELENRLGH